MNEKLVSRPAFLVYAMLLLLPLAYLLVQRNNSTWPVLPDKPGPSPTVMVEVERDFSHRIGDAIPVTIYIKQFAGTTVDIEGLALEGDFELRGEFKTDARSTADGGKILRVRGVLQSFSINPKLRSRISMQWAPDGTKSWQEIEKTEFFLHTSKTWDGRDQIQEGKLTFLGGWHWAKTLAWLILPIIIAIWATIYIRNERLRMPPPTPHSGSWQMSENQWAQERFDVCWERLVNGERDPEIFQEIDFLVRRLMDVESVELRWLDIVLDGHPQKQQAVYIIHSCEQVAFRNKQLSDEQIARIKPLFEDITMRRMRNIRLQRVKRRRVPVPLTRPPAPFVPEPEANASAPVADETAAANEVVAEAVVGNDPAAPPVAPPSAQEPSPESPSDK